MVRKILGARSTIAQLYKPLTEGERLIKQIYIQLLPALPKVGWKNLIFKNAARPKALFTMWLQCQNKLLTVNRLAKWGIKVNPQCVLCLTTTETRDHLFGECKFVVDLWSRLMKWMQIQPVVLSSWNQFFTWIIIQARGKSKRAKLIKMTYAEFAYAVWRERNLRIFKGERRDQLTLAKEISCVCNFRATGDMNHMLQQYYF